MKRYYGVGPRVLEGSLASKLLMLRPGETLYLDDPRDGLTVAPLDRVVQSAAARSSALRGRRFSTRGWIAVQPYFRGIAGEANPDAWRPEHHGKRTILTYVAGQGTTLKLLEDLTDEEIDSRMPAVHARSRRGGSSDAEPS